MFTQLLAYNNVGLFVLRITIGIIFLYHALPKLRGARMMSQAMRMPAIMIFMLGMVEFASSLGVIFGIYTQIAALFLSVVMLGAIYFKTMKWHVPFAAMDKTGWEFDLILLAANITLLLGGGGSIGIT